MSEKIKALGSLDILLSMICAILFADVIISNTSMGPSVIGWWIIIGLIYFIPNGLITAELTGAYPDKGGLYGWVNRAFGPTWAARLSWFYWINCALWMPSSFIWLSGVITGTFIPEANYFMQVIISLIVTWLAIALSARPLTESKWIINIGGVSKIIIFGVVVLAGVMVLINGATPANDLSLEAVLPKLDEGLMFLPVVIYCCCGMEIIATNAHEMKNPSRDLPKAVIKVVLITIIANLLASWAVLMVSPIDDLDLVTGLGTVVSTAFNSPVMYYSVMVILLFSVFVQLITWTIGGARGAAEAGISGELPAVFGKESEKHGMPIGALILSGIVSSVVIVLYGFMAESASDLFFTLLAFSSILFFVPYTIMFPAFIKLRKIDKDAPRPFRAPCGIILAVVCEVILIVGIILFVHVPGQPFDAEYSIPIIIGVAVSVILGEVIVRRQISKMNATACEPSSIAGDIDEVN